MLSPYLQKIGDSARALASAFEKNQTLTAINLESNKNGARLASALEKDKTLTTITLNSNNEIAADCAQALVSALEKNHTLTNTTLADKVGHELKKRIYSLAAESVEKKLQKNLKETKSAIQNANDVDNKTKDGLQNILQEVEGLTKSSSKDRIKALAGESKPINDQEIFEQALQEIMAKGHADEQQIEFLQEQYRKERGELTI